MGLAKPELRAEVRRLRTEQRMSIGEIAEATGAAQGSVSFWLRDIPLSEEEQKVRKQAWADKFVKSGAWKKDRGDESKFHQMVKRAEISRDRKAQIAESAVLFRLALFGFPTSKPVFGGDKVDFLVETRRGIVRVQVKWAASGQHGLPAVSLRCNNGTRKHRRYAKGEFDFLVGYDLFTDTAYVYSEADVAVLTTRVAIRKDAAERWDKLGG